MTLSDQIADREPLGSGGGSGNTLERVTLSDGRELVRKHVSPEWDWISRATADRGRVRAMWEAGLFDRIPPAIDHATVAVEADGSGWSVFMHDVSPSLVAGDRRLDREAVRRVLTSMAELHLQLALIGAMVQLGCNLTLPIVLGRGDGARAAAESELEWWAPTVARALESWSPT